MRPFPEPRSYESRVLHAVAEVFRYALVPRSKADLAWNTLVAAVELTASDGGWVYVVTRHGSLDTIALTHADRNVASAHPLNGAVEYGREFSMDVWARIRESDQTIANAECASSSAYETCLGVPLRKDEETIGMITLAKREGRFLENEVLAVERLSAALGEALFRSLSTRSHRSALVGIQLEDVKPNGDAVLDNTGFRADGRAVPLEVSLAGAELGRLGYTAGIVVDPATRSQQQDALRTSEAMFRAILHSATDCIVVWNTHGSCMYANAAALRYLGHDDSAVGRPINEIVQDDDTLLEWNRRIALVREGGGSLRSRDLLYAGDTPCTMDTTFTPVRSADGAIIAIATICRDVTEWSAAEALARAHGDALEAVFRAQPDIMFVLRRDGTIEDFRAGTVADQLGDSKQFLGAKLHSLLAAEAAADLSAALRALGESESLVVLEFPRFVCGRKRWFEARLVAFEQERALCILREVTDRRAIEEELKRSNEDLQHFAHVASHDLREPLRKITAFGGLLERELGGALGERAREYLDRMLSGAQRMKVLIDDVLALSRVESSGRPMVSVDLDAIVARVLEDMSGRTASSSAEVIVRSLPQVAADETQMYQLFQNLVANAIKFRNEDVAPRVEISAEVDLDVYTIHVKDNGIGIAPEHQARVFQLFQRLHSHEDYEGTGMGLALCSRIVRRHGGTIAVESAEGAGSTFIVRLPFERLRPREDWA